MSHERRPDTNGASVGSRVFGSFGSRMFASFGSRMFGSFGSRMFVGAALLMLLITPRLFAATTTNVALTVNESRQLRILGVTAAWAVDAAIVDATVMNGGVALVGRSPGRTRVVVIGITGENALDVVVAGKPVVRRPQSTAASDRQTVAEVRYSSATKEVQNSVTMVRQDADKRTEINLRTLHQTGETNADRAKTSVPVVSYSIFTKNREITFFDRDVQHSPLTLYNTPLRGLHYVDEHWRVHAGYTAWATYQSFLVPVERESVFGAGYALRPDANTTFTPSVFVYPGQGAVASLLYDRKFASSTLRSELGVSNHDGMGVGAAVQYWLDQRNDQVRVDVRYRPTNFAMVGPGDVRGLRADGSWSHAYGRGSNVAAMFSAVDYAATHERVFAAQVDVDQRLTDTVSLLGGASVGSFYGRRSIAVPLGVDLHFARGSVTALYRYAESGTNRGGHGGRLAARTSLGRFFFSGYVDRQQNAPTLEVIFNEQPELALALSELGIAATSPADVARALREHAELAELGFIEGVTVDFAPLRTQAGIEAAWLGASAARHQLRARVLHSVIEGVTSRSTTTIAGLSYSRRITGSTDLFASYTYWRSERRGQEANVQPYVEVGVRQRFDGVPSFNGSGTISGIVYADEDHDGVSDGTGVIAEVELDGSARQQTDVDGRFSFRNVSRGAHRVSARVSRPDAYFTTPSRVEAQPGDQLAFGIATTPARVIGRVVNDAGRGIAGVRVMLTRGERQVAATSDSVGTFSATTAPGQYDISIVPDSVPTGYALTGIDTQSVMLDREQPRTVEWQLRALRSITGSGAPPNADVLIEPLGKRVRTDGSGRFSVRSLPSGELTLVAGNTRRTVVLSSDPASVAVDFGTTVAAATVPVPEVRTIVSGERRDTMHGFVVQIGAFRVRSNAEDALQRARRSGVEAQIRSQGGLTVVSAGPYPTNHAAAVAATQLRKAGLEAVITSRK